MNMQEQYFTSVLSMFFDYLIDCKTYIRATERAAKSFSKLKMSVSTIPLLYDSPDNKL